MRTPTSIRLILVGIVGLALSLYLFGIRKDLPYIQEIDEDFFVAPAVRVAATAKPNPGWFGHPGSTIIYPLAGVYHVWNAVTHGGGIGRPDPGLQLRFDSNPGKFYLLGRLLVVLYAGLSIPLVYHLGRRAFGERVGLVGSFLSAIYPIVVSYAQVVRTDTAATFFTLLGLWLCLRLYDQPSTRNRVLAGAAIGLGIATRYLMGPLALVLIAVDGLIIWRRGFTSIPDATARPKQALQLREFKAALPRIGVGLLSALAAFAISTPYFFLDFRAALRSIRSETAPHPGGDGLSPLGNLFWYLTTAIPDTISWPQVVLAAIGVVLVLRGRRPERLLLLGFAGIFLVGISLFPLHWARWIFQLLPLLGLLAATALVVIVAQLSRQLAAKTPKVELALTLAALAVVVAIPAQQVASLELRQMTPGTRIQAREWITQNLPAGIRIASERFSAPMTGTDFVVWQRFALAADTPLDTYYREGYTHLAVANSGYQLYLSQPDRYPAEAAFYRRLFAEGRLLNEIVPSPNQRGSTIRIYELPRPDRSSRDASNLNDTGTNPIRPGPELASN